MTSIFRNYFAGDHDNRRKRADARRGKLEEAEKFKDDDVNLSQIVRVGVLEQFFRALRELRDRVVTFLDLLENDVSLLKSRFGPQLVVGFDCRRQLVQSLLYPLLIIWLPITAVMVIRGDLKNEFETRLYDVLRDPPPSSPLCSYQPRPQRYSCPVVEAVAPRSFSGGVVFRWHGSQCPVSALQVPAFESMKA
jgi:hypothetical protein